MDGMWVTCRCGKERNVPDDGMAGMAAASLCRSCSDQFHRDMDSCPESVRSERGVHACSLGYCHVGRCVPFATDAELERWAKARGWS